MNNYRQRERESAVEAWLREEQPGIAVPRDLRHRVLQQARQTERDHALFGALLALCLMFAGAGQWVFSQLPNGGNLRHGRDVAAAWADSLTTIPPAQVGDARYALSWSGPIPRSGDETVEDISESHTWRFVRSRVDRQAFRFLTGQNL